MPEKIYYCEHCRVRERQFAPQVAHRCAAMGQELIDMIPMDGSVPPVDLCCDGCDAERLGSKEMTFSNGVAKTRARLDGWVCDKSGDWCPRCAMEKGKVKA